MADLSSNTPEQETNPTCEKCGYEVTTGLMVVFCPEGSDCEFWPKDATDEVKVTTYEMWEQQVKANLTVVKEGVNVMRTALVHIRDECFSGAASKAAARALEDLTKLYEGGAGRIVEPETPQSESAEKSTDKSPAAAQFRYATMYESKVSGMLYANHAAAGDVSAIIYLGQRFVPSARGERDAARWQFALAHGFPTCCFSPPAGKAYWYVRGFDDLPECLEWDTPIKAIDAAMEKANVTQG